MGGVGIVGVQHGADIGLSILHLGHGGTASGVGCPSDLILMVSA
jgi:hypothetical protein